MCTSATCCVDVDDGGCGYLCERSICSTNSSAVFIALSPACVHSGRLLSGQTLAGCGGQGLDPCFVLVCLLL